MKVENLSAKRFFIQCKNELFDLLPASGTVDLPVGADEEYLDLLQEQGRVKIYQTKNVEDAVIIDEKSEVVALRAEYKKLTGKKADTRWSEAKLKEKIEEVEE